MKSIAILFAFLASTAYSQVGFESRNFYLRCNATTWDINDSNRLKSGSNGNLQTLVVDNKGMLEDDCVVMETNAVDSWGSKHHPLASDRNPLASGERANLRHVTMAEEASAHFKVKYPFAGRFVFTFDFSASQLTFNPESIKGLFPTAAVAWTKTADVFSDALGNAFAGEQGNKFSRFDAATGKALWTVQGTQSIAYSQNCVTTDAVYLLRDNKVTAVKIADGKTVWTSDFNSQFDPNSGFLSCFTKSKNLFFTYSQDQGAQTKFAGLDMATGKVLWTHEAQGSTGLLDATADHVLLSKFQDGTSYTLLLDQKTGKTLWTRDNGMDWVTIDRAGRVLVQGQQSIMRLGVTSGKPIWKYQRPSSTSTYLLTNLATTDMFVQHNDGFARLNPVNGKVLWFRNVEPNLSYGIEVLATSNLLYSDSDYSVLKSTFKLVNVGDGTDLWSKSDTTATTVAADNKGRIYLRSLSKLSRLSQSGKKMWTLIAPKPEGVDVNFGPLYSKDGSLFAQYYSQSGHHHFPPSGLLSIGDNNGKLKWIHATPGPVNLVSAEHAQVVTIKNFMNNTTTALKK